MVTQGDVSMYNRDKDTGMPTWIPLTLGLFAPACIVAYFVYSIGMTLVTVFNQAFAGLLP